MANKSDQLEGLNPEARQRVEDVLARAIEAELTGSAQRRAAFSRSVFSRSSGIAKSFSANTLSSLAAIDDAAFKKAAERLSQLSSIKAPTAK